jgi:hypothetical protein
MLKGNKSEKIRKLLDKGVDRKEVAKKLNASDQLVYAVAVNGGYIKKGKKKPSKIIRAVKEMKQVFDALESKPTKLFVRPEHKDAALKLIKGIDVVNNPPHYKTGGIDTLDFIEAKDLNFRLANVVKYVVRCGKKLNSDPVEDLEKAKFYLEREIEARRGA